MLMCHKVTHKRIDRQPPRRYSEQQKNRQTRLDKPQISAIMKIEKGIADKRLARTIQQISMQ